MVVVSAVALSEKVPDPDAAPARLHAARRRPARPRRDRDRPRRRRLRARRPGRRPRPVRGPRRPARRLPRDRGARVRVDLFDVEIESLRWFSTFTQRSLGDTELVEIAPAAELAAEHRELAEIAALEQPDERPDIAELLPVDRFRDLLDLIPGEAELIIAAEEDIEPALRDHWDDVCAAFHDTDAHQLYVKPERHPRRSSRRAGRCGCPRSPAPSRSSSAPRRPSSRPARCARPSPSWRSSSARDYTDARHLAEPRRRRARRLQPRSASSRAGAARTRASCSRRPTCATASSRPGSSLAVIPEHRLFHRRRATHAADAPRPRPAAQLRRPAHGRLRRPRGPRRRALRRLRHEDRRRHHARLPRTSSSRATTRSSCRSTSSRRSAATSAPAATRRRSPSSAASAGTR